MELKDMLKNGTLSVRAFNVCREHGLSSLDEIKTYHRNHQSFIGLANCGRRTDKELKSLCNRYDNENWMVRPERKFIQPLDPIRTAMVENFIQVSLNRLSVRSINALKSFCEGEITLDKFRKRIWGDPMFDLRNLPNVGDKSSIELNRFFNAVEDFVSDLQKKDDGPELIVERNVLLLQKVFDSLDIASRIDRYDRPLKITENLIKGDAIFTGEKNAVFRRMFYLFNDSPRQSRDAIANHFKRTSERIRQLKVEFLQELDRKFAFIAHLGGHFFEGFESLTNTPMIFFNEADTERINRQNETDFSPPFLMFLLSAALPTHFSVVGDLGDVFVESGSRSRRRHKWKNIYLTNKDMVDAIDFIGLIDDLDRKGRGQIPEDIHLKLREMTFSFSKPGYVPPDEALAVVRQVIENEFADISVNDGVVTIPRNTIKLTWEYAHEALEAIGKPIHVIGIAKKAMELNPGYIASGEQMRSAMVARPEFVSIGRTSTYGLKTWEKELQNFKGGTIRGIVAAYLEDRVEPVGIEEITAHVLKFRPNSGKYSILHNLKSDTSNTFAFFEKSAVGLKSKTYPDAVEEVTPPKPGREWAERFEDLSQFVKSHERLPRSSSVPEEEIKLYRWFAIQRRLWIRGELSAEKDNRLREYVEMYLQDPKRQKRQAETKNVSDRADGEHKPSKTHQLSLFDEDENSRNR